VLDIAFISKAVLLIVDFFSPSLNGYLTQLGLELALGKSEFKSGANCQRRRYSSGQCALLLDGPPPAIRPTFTDLVRDFCLLPFLLIVFFFCIPPCDRYSQEQVSIENHSSSRHQASAC